MRPLTWRHWMTRVALALTVAALSLLPTGHSTALADGEIVVDLGVPDDSGFPDVSVVVTADRAGRPLPELRSEQVIALEGGQPATVLSVQPAQQAGVPLALVITIDVSGSMEGAAIDQARAAAGDLLRRLSPEDRAAIVAFSEEARTVQPMTTDRASTIQAVAGLRALGNTALYDGVAESVRVASEAGVGRRAVIFLSDGREFGGASRLTRDQSIEAAATSGAVFYMVGVGPDIDVEYLDSVAARTGGRFFRAAGAAEVPSIYAALEELLRTQFIVTLRSNAPPTGAERQLDLELRVGDGQGRQARAYASRRDPAITTPATPLATGEGLTARPPVAGLAPEGGIISHLSRVFLAAGSGLVLLALAFGIGALYLARRRRRKRAPVQLRSLWRGVNFVDSAAEDASRAASAVLRVRSGGAVGARVPVPPTSGMIGTAEDCAIRLEAGIGIAEHHARFWWRDGHALVEHLAPGHETRVNGRAIEWAPLDVGYELQIGPTLVMRYEATGAAASASAPRRNAA